MQRQRSRFVKTRPIELTSGVTARNEKSPAEGIEEDSIDRLVGLKSAA
jgi:hypothetical protein